MPKNSRFSQHADNSETCALELFGESPGYPGHPVLIGTLTMDRYASYAHATTVAPGSPHANALRDGFIPGAGCAVHAALDCLKLALDGAANSRSAALAEAERYWINWEHQSANNATRAAIGRSQAERAQARYFERLEGWQTGKLPPCPYRLDPATGAIDVV
jgi:hypothetical protein